MKLSLGNELIQMGDNLSSSTQDIFSLLFLYLLHKIFMSSCDTN